MTITIPANRSIALKAKSGGGFASEAIVDVAVSGFSGTNGEIVTVSDSGFTSKANPQPSAFDTFNDYGLSEGQVIPTGGAGQWSTNLTAADDFEVDSAQKLTGRTFSALAQGPKATLVLAPLNPSGPARSNEFFYSSHWIRFNESLDAPPQNNASKSDKVLRVWEDGTDSNTATKTSFEATTKLAQYYNGETNTNFNYPSQAIFFAPNAWHRIDYGIDRAAGKQYLWLDGTKYIYDWFPATTNIADPPNEFYTRLLGYDPASVSDVTTTLRHWLAEFYEHPSPVTLELTNSATWDDNAKPHSFMQKCISATAFEIQFELFLGDLNTGQPIYLWQRTAFDNVQMVGQVN